MIYRGAELGLCKNVYEPSDDSFLLADNIELKEGETVLDMGTGCGIQGIIAAKMGAAVTSTDVNGEALECTRKNALLNGVNITFLKSDLFEKVKGEFDLIVFNPPYLPSEPGDINDELRFAWDGGEDGAEITNRFLEGLEQHLLEDGRALLVTSSLSMGKKTETMFKKHNLNIKKIDEKPFFFEKLYLFMLRR